MKPSWSWAAYGKHPVAKDYFRLGKDFPLSKGFSDWVEKGYPLIASRKDIRPELSSWRFWARGPGKDGLACGLVRDSSDRVGRPYPLLIMGAGGLRGWQDQWDLVPFACERTWEQIEYLSALIVTDFRKFEMAIQNIRVPGPDWSEFYGHRLTFGDGKIAQGDEPWCDSRGADLLSRLTEKTEIYISLDEGPFRDQFARIGFWHAFFKTSLKALPNVIFMGGTPEKAWIALYRRPLVPSDLLDLWSLSSREAPQGIFRLQ
jgi:type VI secretion system protein VasJ